MRNRHSPINPRRCSLSHDGRQAAFLSLSLSFSLSLSLALSLSLSLSPPRSDTIGPANPAPRLARGDHCTVRRGRTVYNNALRRARARARTLALSLFLSFSLSRSLSGTRGERRMSCTVSRSLSIVVCDDDLPRKELLRVATVPCYARECTSFAPATTCRIPAVFTSHVRQGGEVR